jgi:hypothetical protein
MLKRRSQKFAGSSIYRPSERSQLAPAHCHVFYQHLSSFLTALGTYLERKGQLFGHLPNFDCPTIMSESRRSLNVYTSTVQVPFVNVVMMIDD